MTNDIIEGYVKGLEVLKGDRIRATIVFDLSRIEDKDLIEDLADKLAWHKKVELSIGD